MTSNPLVPPQDGGGRAGFSSLHVRVADANELPPAFTQPSYRALLPANASRGALVAKVKKG